MAKAYSQDLRKRALNLIESGMSITNVSRVLEISRTTLYRWQHRLNLTGSITPLVRGESTWSSKIKDWKKFEDFVKLHGEKTQEEMASLWGNCTRHTISRGLKKIGYTRKKNDSISRTL